MREDKPMLLRSETIHLRTTVAGTESTVAGTEVHAECCPVLQIAENMAMKTIFSNRQN